MPEVRENRTKHRLQNGEPAIVVSATDPDTIEVGTEELARVILGFVKG